MCFFYNLRPSKNLRTRIQHQEIKNQEKFPYPLTPIQTDIKIVEKISINPEENKMRISEFEG